MCVLQTFNRAEVARVQNEGTQIRRLVREREHIGDVDGFLRPLSELQVASSTPSADSERCGETQIGSASPIPAVTVTAEGETLLEAEKKDGEGRPRENLRTREEPPGNSNALIFKMVGVHIKDIFEQVSDDVLSLPTLSTRVRPIFENIEPDLPECICILCSLLFSNIVQRSLVALSVELTCRRRI